VQGLLAALSRLQALNEDMTIAAAISFLAVAMSEGRSLTEYADMLERPHSTMSRHLKDLGEFDRKRESGLRLIEQRTDPADRRKNIYRLTARGKKLSAELDRLSKISHGRRAKSG
jgi:DNA-binding MarR family transcriptional regulator